MDTETKEDLLSFAKLCHKAGRFDDMVEAMKKVWLESDRIELNNLNFPPIFS